jgi:dihydroorotate dehydrogenase
MPLLARWTSNVAVSGGLTTPADGIKAILAGADAVQLVSALLVTAPRTSAPFNAVSSSGWNVNYWRFRGG